MADIKKVSIGGTQYDIRDANAIEKGYAVNDFATNCITEIPQDITLTLSSGTLTLKSGSVVTFPDGTQYQTTADKTVSTGFNNGLNFICLYESTFNMAGRPVANSVSGAGATTTAGLAYDTTANKVGFYNISGQLSAYCSFPFCIVNVESGVITSIDKVFNGAGYIGHHAFVLPDVKGLIPNGFNTDGTLKNVVRKNAALRIVEMGTSSPATGFEKIIYMSANAGSYSATNYKEVSNLSSVSTESSYSYQYVQDQNKIYLYNSGNLSPISNGFVKVLSYEYNGTTVTKFEVRPVSGLSHYYIQNALTGVSGYASNKTQTLKHVNGVLTFVDG